MSKFQFLWPLALVSHFATAQAVLPQVAAPPAASTQFKPAEVNSAQPVLPSDLGPPGALEATQAAAQQQAMAQQQTFVQQQAAYYAQQRALANRPNLSNQQNKSTDIMNAFMNMFNGGGGSGGKKVPEPYLPNGEVNPEFDSYIRGGGKLPGGMKYSNGFTPSEGGPEIKQNFSGLCEKYPVANLNKNFKNWDCDQATKDRMTCMVCNIYFEARDQGTKGQVAVGQSSLHRLFSTQYAKQGEGLCDVVYRKSEGRGRSVGQYSWTTDGKDHKMKELGPLQTVIDSAQKSLCGGPNEWTNYYGPDSMVPRNRVPPWWNSDCKAGTKQDVEKHKFCAVGGKMNRSIAEVMSSDRVNPVEGASVTIREPAQGTN